ncbi:MAG: hypothetical protein ACREV7_18215 [Steroidobacteraceae bacterium]
MRSQPRPSLRRGTLTLADYARVDSSALTMRSEEIRLRFALAQAALGLLLALPF